VSLFLALSEIKPTILFVEDGVRAPFFPQDEPRQGEVKALNNKADDLLVTRKYGTRER
jgi:hypothetical protein